MRALVLDTVAGWTSVELPEPQLSAGEVLVEVHAAGLNRADLLMREGTYVPDDASWNVARDRVGFEMAGRVVGLGPGVGGVSVGERVMAQCGGACAERVAVDHRLLLPMPEHRSWAQAASLPSAVMTSYDALTGPAALGQDERVLVTGATSGVGLVAVELARRLGAAFVVGTTREPARAAQVLRAGVDAVVVTGDLGAWEPFQEPAGRFNVVMDHVGGDLVAELLPTLARGGRLVQIGRLGGAEATVDLELVASRRISLIGTTFRGRTLEELAALTQAVLVADVLGDVKANVDRVYPFAQAEQAARHLAAGTGSGKVIIRLRP